MGNGVLRTDEWGGWRWNKCVSPARVLGAALYFINRVPSCFHYIRTHLASGYVNGFVQHYPHGRLPAAGVSGGSFVRHVVLDVREHLPDGYVLYRARRTCAENMRKNWKRNKNKNKKTHANGAHGGVPFDVHVHSAATRVRSGNFVCYYCSSHTVTYTRDVPTRRGTRCMLRNIICPAWFRATKRRRTTTTSSECGLYGPYRVFTYNPVAYDHVLYACYYYDGTLTWVTIIIHGGKRIVFGA